MSTDRRRKVLAGRIRSGLVMLFIWVALVLATAGGFASIANSLPGIVPFEDASVSAGIGVASLFFIGVAVLMVSWDLAPKARTRAPWSVRRRRLRHFLQRVALLTRRLLRDVLGLLIVSRRQAMLVVILGVIGAAAAYGLAWVLTSIPELAASVPATDARFDAVSGAPAWVPPVFFAVYAPVPEEIRYRSLVLVAAFIASTLRTPWIRVVVIGVALLGSSYAFGAVHESWSLLNAVHAAFTGLIYGAASLVARSLWAGIVAHALYNALAGLG